MRTQTKSAKADRHSRGRQHAEVGVRRNAQGQAIGRVTPIRLVPRGFSYEKVTRARIMEARRKALGSKRAVPIIRRVTSCDA